MCSTNLLSVLIERVPIGERADQQSRHRGRPRFASCVELPVVLLYPDEKMICHFSFFRQSDPPKFLGNIGDGYLMKTLDPNTHLFGIIHVTHGYETTMITPHIGHI
jgi:hypothetical protein